MLLLLDKKEASLFSKIWTGLKIFLKEGLIYQDWKAVFKNRKVGGSITIPSELAVGLKKTNVPFLHNHFSLKTQISTAVVVKDPKCLEWALKQKRKGRIERVLAGPLVANLPTEADGLLTHPDLDGLLFFSPWHRDMFLKFCTGPHPKTFIWAAGVDENFWTPSSSSRDQILIYDKNPDPELLQHVKATLQERKLNFKILTYGHYDLTAYQEELKHSRFVIFLSRTETQGVAMLEAWSSGVPSLHWNPGVWHYLGQKVSGASSCPYLEPGTGLSFKNQENFRETLNQMLAQLDTFDPRTAVLNRFTRAQSIHHFLEIVQQKDFAGSP